MKISIASDHGGLDLKEYLVKELHSKFEIKDNGCFNYDSVDYPIYGLKVANDVKNKAVDFGIAICTNGIGMSIVCNKVKTVRAALCLNDSMASHARSHNNANVICLGEVNQSHEEALQFVLTFLSTPFTDKDRHYRRVNEISKIDEGE